tara:strand:- start:620 stop:745 length:126 start_codon:yes stop_codon:yes gene_type:complete
LAKYGGVERENKNHLLTTPISNAGFGVKTNGLCIFMCAQNL